MSPSPYDFGPQLKRSFSLAKHWAHDRGARDLPPDAFLEATCRIDPDVPQRALSGQGVEEARLRVLASRAEQRPEQHSELGPREVPTMDLSPLLARPLLSAAEGDGDVSLERFLNHLAADEPFIQWFRAHYAPPADHQPLLAVRELIDLLARHHQLTSRAARQLTAGDGRAEESLLDVERLRAEVEARWNRTPSDSPVRELYNGWGVDPLSAAASPVETVLVQELREPGEDPVSMGALTRLACLDAYPRGARNVIEGVEQAQVFGLVQRLPFVSTDTPTPRDRLIATESLLLDVATATERDPIDATEHARAQRWLSVR
jgi:hypothetical protein